MTEPTLTDTELTDAGVGAGLLLDTVQRIKAEAVDRERAAWATKIEGLLADGPDAWTPYDSRDTGETFLSDSVLDFTADLRGLLAADDTEATP